MAKKESEYKTKGRLLYISLAFCYVLGTHKLLNFKNF